MEEEEGRCFVDMMSRCLRLPLLSTQELLMEVLTEPLVKRNSRIMRVVVRLSRLSVCLV